MGVASKPPPESALEGRNIFSVCSFVTGDASPAPRVEASLEVFSLSSPDMSILLTRPEVKSACVLRQGVVGNNAPEGGYEGGGCNQTSDLFNESRDAQALPDVVLQVHTTVLELTLPHQLNPVAGVSPRICDVYFHVQQQQARNRT